MTTSSFHPLPARVAVFPSGSALTVPPRLSRSTSVSSDLGRRARDREAFVADVDIVIPVHNEQRVLAASVRRLHRFLASELPFSWRIIVADNASSDDTPAIARALAQELPGVQVLRLEAKGRGRALRAAWSASDARVVCYMDVDLSTDLKALLPLLAPLLSGHSDLAIGSRLARGAAVIRGLKREFISRAYNRLLHLVLRAGFSDAQCGFKAVRGDAVAKLLGDVRDESWFFDTELLMAAQRRGLRIYEVPVDWVEDQDSSVDVITTALADLRGVARISLATPVARFLAIGIVSTAAYAMLFIALLAALGAGMANAMALATTSVGNIAANRRLTFGIRGHEDRSRQYAAGALVFAITLGLTTAALAVLHGLDPRAPHALDLAVLIVATVVATISRYVALRTWVFSYRRSPFAAQPTGPPFRPLPH